MKEGQDAKSLASVVAESLCEWDLGTMSQPGSFSFPRVRAFTTDTTAVMPKMAELLGIPWVPCAAHVLNLVTSDSLKVRPPPSSSTPLSSTFFYLPFPIF